MISVAVARITKSFTATCVLALLAGLGLAVLIAPVAAVGIFHMGFRFPFPRIFDRVVMLTQGLALAYYAGPLGVVTLMRQGFGEPRRNALRGLAGFVVVLVSVGVLLALAAILSRGRIPAGALAARAATHLAGAVLIGIIEEGFFRAFLLGGMTRDFDRLGALVTSSAVFALVHLARSPARFYVTNFEPTVGIANLESSFSRLACPGNLFPMLLGLFLVGLLLGEAFVLTGRIYLSAGMHAALVLGAKTWPVVGHAGGQLPGWLAGPGPIPMVAAPAAWGLIVVLMVILPGLLRRRDENLDQRGLSRAS